MKLANLNTFTRGWLIGDFSNSLIRTSKAELAIKRYKKGDFEPAHYHLKSDEITIIVSGSVKMDGLIFNEGDIITIEAGEATNFECLEDAITTVYRGKSVPNDKYLVDNNTEFKVCSCCHGKKVIQYFGIKNNMLRSRCKGCRK